jgi:hypothetical protein
MPSPEARHEPTIPCPPPTDPTGFIYSSYRAAQTETPKDKAPLKDSLQEDATIALTTKRTVAFGALRIQTFIRLALIQEEVRYQIASCG